MMCRNGWYRSGLSLVVGLGSVVGVSGQGQEISLVADREALVEYVGRNWTNDSMAKLFPPQTSYNLSLGGIAFESTFETGLVANLVAVTNDTVVLYPVHVIETNSPSRQRIYFNAADVAVHTSTVGVVG